MIGAVVGGLTGKSVAETVDPTAEEAYWRESYTREPYYRDGHTHDDYAPAYGLGIGSLVADKYRDRSFDDIEGSLAEEWDIYRGNSRLNWTEASTAARAAWARAQRDRGAVHRPGLPGGDADHLDLAHRAGQGGVPHRGIRSRRRRRQGGA